MLHTYILRCADGSYYVGHTDDLDTQLTAHQRGRVSAYTATRRPVALAWSESFERAEDALARERQLRGWTRAKKEALIAGDFERLRMLARSRESVRSAQGATPGAGPERTRPG
jgi:predicted GIY-YIG superfamily endonuclease